MFNMCFFFIFVLLWANSTQPQVQVGDNEESHFQFTWFFSTPAMLSIEKQLLLGCNEPSVWPGGAVFLLITQVQWEGGVAVKVWVVSLLVFFGVVANHLTVFAINQYPITFWFTLKKNTNMSEFYSNEC